MDVIVIIIIISKKNHSGIVNNNDDNDSNHVHGRENVPDVGPHLSQQAVVSLALMVVGEVL